MLKKLILIIHSFHINYIELTNDTTKSVINDITKLHLVTFQNFNFNS